MITKNCPSLEFSSISLKTRNNFSLFFLASLFLTAISLCSTFAVAQSTSKESTPQLVPYSAIYTTTYSGVSAEMEQKFSKQTQSRWRLHSKASILFADIIESANFEVHGDKVKPIRYRYENEISSRRDSDLVFDWKQKLAKDSKQKRPPVTLKSNLWDKLSFQVQLRIDLMQQAGSFSEKEYPQMDRGRVKLYTINKLGEEIVNTEAGKFHAIKLEQRRPGKKDHTLIWLAKDWDYMLVKLERIEDGESSYIIDLQEAVLGSKRVRSL